MKMESDPYLQAHPTKRVKSEAYPVSAVDPQSVQFSKRYTIGQALAVSRRPAGFSLGQLRIAHNSLYAEANRLDDDKAMNAAFHARELLWQAIIERDRR